MAEGVDNFASKVGRKNRLKTDFRHFFIATGNANSRIAGLIALKSPGTSTAETAAGVLGFLSDVSRTDRENSVGDLLDVRLGNERDELEKFAHSRIVREGTGNNGPKALGQNIIGTALGSIESAMWRVYPNTVAGECNGKCGRLIAADAKMLDRFEDRRMINNEQIDTQTNSFITNGRGQINRKQNVFHPARPLPGKKPDIIPFLRKMRRRDAIHGRRDLSKSNSFGRNFAGHPDVLRNTCHF